jgi:hypothetical protein
MAIGQARHRPVDVFVGDKRRPARGDARDPILRVRLNEQRDCETEDRR